MILQKTIDLKPRSISNNYENDISQTLRNLKSLNALQKTCLPTLDGNIFIRLVDISHFKSEDIYCRLITCDGETIFITKPLKWVEHKLHKSGFYRIHKSYFINVLNIRQYFRNDGGYLMMDSGKHVPISRSKKNQIQKLFQEL